MKREVMGGREGGDGGAVMGLLGERQWVRREVMRGREGGDRG